MQLLAHRPRFQVEAAAGFLRVLFGLEGSVVPLPSERDQNFLVTTSQGARFVFKIANATEDRGLLEAQQAALQRLAERGAVTPRVVPSTRGETLVAVESPSGPRHLSRVVTFLDGVPLATTERRSSGLFEDLGRRLGQVDRALDGFDHPALHRDFHWDLANAVRVVAAYAPLVADQGLRSLVTSVTTRVERGLAPLLPDLRRGTIHNDANDHNVLVGGGDDFYTRNQRVTGLLDFGDMIHGWRAAEPAIAIAYAVLEARDPLLVAADIVRGYHAEHPLTEAEIAAVFPLACLRLCQSVCLAADQQRQQPDDAYLGVSQGPIARTLPRLARIPDRLAEATLRHACGLPPVPSSEAIVRWLASRAERFAPVLGVDLRQEPALVLDLGIGSPLVSADERENEAPALTARLAAEMAKAGAAVAVGRYDEARLLYTSELFAVVGAPGERRTTHLGIDLFAPPGTPLRAPLPGVVHASAVNTARHDYGPVTILRHETDEGQAFFTLYGHLSRASLEALSPGTTVGQGETFAAIGTPDENGGWTPHVHVQLIVDTLGLDTDFPGVCRAGERAVWRSVSPDPNVILGIPAERFPSPEIDARRTLAERRERLGGNVSLAYREPVKIVRGWMQYLWDETGRRYLDAYNNVPHVGHCHPRVVAAGQRQMALLNTNTRYLHDLVNRYAERLANTLPPPLRVCFFVNSASEANELALRLARARTGRRDMVVLDAAYHGHTTSLIDISPYKHAGPGGEGPPAWVHRVPLPDVYRGAHRRGDPRVGSRYARYVQEAISALRGQGRGLAGFIAETCPSVGGQVVLPDGYLAEVYRFVREGGGVCIADEVQTGFGRIGTHFWAFEAHGVVPDIVVMGKPIGNGHPIGAVVTTPEIAAAFDNGMEFFSTFGGNPVSCAIGLAVLDVLQEEGLQAHALEVGHRLLDGLRRLGDRYPIVGDVRGSGLFLGVELVRDRVTLEPAGAEASFIANRLKELGILLGTDGPFHNVVKIRPPMPFSPADADHLVQALEAVLHADFLPG